MRRWSLIACSLVLTVAALAWAASVHWKPGDPELIEQDTSLLVMGSLAGLSNATVTINVTATGVPDVLCTTRGGNNSPGQNPGEVTLVGTQIIPADEVQNGQVSVSLVTQPPANPDPAVACPNKNWLATIQSIDFTSAIVTVSQNGVVVLEEMFDL